MRTKATWQGEINGADSRMHREIQDVDLISTVFSTLSNVLKFGGMVHQGMGSMSFHGWEVN